MKHRYMAGAFNVFNLDTLMAVVSAAEAEQSPVIVQVSMGTRRYTRDFPFFIETLRRAAAAAKVPVMIQHDHCASLADCIAAAEEGFPAVMFDGSHLPPEENIRQTKEAVLAAHENGAWLEAELGNLPGFEDDIFSESNVYTDPEEAYNFVRETGCDALAVAVGTSHGGVLSEESLPLDFTRLEEIHHKLPGCPLVLHGGASLPRELIDAINAEGAQVPYFRNAAEEDIARCGNLGVCKVNMDVDNFMVFSTAVRRVLNRQPGKYDPQIYLREGRDAFEAEVGHKMRSVLHSSGKADLFSF
jgi:fructose-bisphosphate aldolase class II